MQPGLAFPYGETTVTVHARGRSWRLHRLVRSRSPFFKAMLTGDWAERESGDNNLHLLGSSAAAGGDRADSDSDAQLRGQREFLLLRC